MVVKLYNTLSNQKEAFSPLNEGVISMYHCGPTVYGKQHIGNLSMYVFTDILRRTFEYFYPKIKIKQVINITDFGHLSSDSDEGDDKMTKGLRAENMELTMENMRILAEKYANIWKEDLKELNIKTDDTKFPFASDYVEQQKKLIEKLEEKSFTYKTSDGIYFDTSKFPNYGKLGNIQLGEESRIEENNEKRNQKDFALWKFNSPMSDMGNEKLGWESKWGQGFPGWHIECTAMIFALLGEQIDIHTGGIEHIGVHHNNEIAQAEAVSDKSPFSRFWLHREHIRIDETKISKSIGNVIYLSDLKEHGIHPMSFRYWLLTSRYNTPSNFTWEAVEAAQTILEKIIINYTTFSEGPMGTLVPFEKALADDLNTPAAISFLHEAKSKEEVSEMDKVLGLNIAKLAKQVQNIPSEILDLQKQRDDARKNEDWKISDDLRKQIENRGFRVLDSEKTLIFRTLKSLI